MSKHLLRAFARDDPERFAQLLAASSDAAQARAVLEDIPDELAGDLVARLTPEAAHRLLNDLPDDVVGEWLAACTADTGRRLLSQISRERAARLITGIGNRKVRRDLQRLVAYPAGSIGEWVHLGAIAIAASAETAAIAAEIQKHGGEPEAPVAIVDNNGQVTGVLDLALEDPNNRLNRIMHPAEAVLSALDRREEIVEMLDQFRLDALPVVDSGGKLMGVVRYGSLFRAIETVAISGMQKMVGNAEERALSTAGFAVKKRLPWLHINLLTAFLAASVVGLFEDIIAQFTALAILLPVVAGQSGNAGAQALAVTMRGLALREIGLREWKKVLNKEVLVGIINGVALAITCGAGVYLWSRSLGLAVVIGVAMILSMLAAGISGAVVPILLTRAGQDPATASSIILTTVTDVAGFFSFLGTATLLVFLL